MSIPEISALAETIGRSDPRNPEVQASNLQAIRSLRSTMERGGAKDLIAFLDTAAVLTEALSRIGNLGPEEVLKLISKLVGMVEDAFQEPARVPGPSPAPPPPAYGPPPAPAAPAKSVEQPAAPKPVRELPTVDTDNSSLRLMQELFLGEILVQMGTVSQEQVESGLQIQRATGLRIGEALVQLGAVTWEDIRRGVEFQERLRQSGGWRAQ